MSATRATHPAEQLVASLEASPFCRVGAHSSRLLFSKHARDRHAGAVSLLLHVLRQRGPQCADCFDDPMQLIRAGSSVFVPALAWGRFFSVCTRHAALLMRRGGQLETFQADQVRYTDLMADGVYTDALLESAAATEANGALRWQLEDELCAFAYGVQAWMSRAIVQHASPHVVSDHSLVFVCGTHAAVQATIPESISPTALGQLQNQRGFFAVTLPAEAGARASHGGDATGGTCGRLASMCAMQDGSVLAWYLAAHSNMLLREIRARVPPRIPSANPHRRPLTGSGDLHEAKRRREPSNAPAPLTDRPPQPPLQPPVAPPVAPHSPRSLSAPEPDTSLEASVLQTALGRIMTKITDCVVNEETAVAVDLIDMEGMDTSVQLPLFVNMMSELHCTPDTKLGVLLQRVFPGAAHETTREFFEAAAYTFQEVQREITRTFLLDDPKGRSFCALHPGESPLHTLGSGVSNTVYGVSPTSMDADGKHAALRKHLSNLLSICGHVDLSPSDLAIRVPSHWVASTPTELVEIARVVVQYAFAASRDVGVQLIAAYIFPLSQLVDVSALEAWDPLWNPKPPKLPVDSTVDDAKTAYGLMLVTRRMCVSIGTFGSAAVAGDDASLCDDIRSKRGEVVPLVTSYPAQVDGLLDCVWSMLERMALSGVAVIDFHMGNLMLTRTCRMHPDGAARIVDFDARFSTIFANEEVSKGVLPIFLLNALRMLAGLACDRGRRPLLHCLLCRLKTRALPHRMRSEAGDCAYDIVALTDHVLQDALATPEDARSIAQRLLMLDWHGGFQNTGVTVLSSMYGNQSLCKLVHHASSALATRTSSTTDAVNTALKSHGSSVREHNRDWTFGDLSSLTHTAHTNKFYENVNNRVWTKAYELQPPKFSSSAVATFEHARFAVLLCTHDVYVSQPLTYALRCFARVQKICEVHARALLKAKVGPGVVNVADVLTSGALRREDHDTVAEMTHLLTDMFVKQPHVGIRLLLPSRETPMPLAQAYASMVVTRFEPTAHELTVTVPEHSVSGDDPFAPIQRTTLAPPQAFFGF